jgi:hypothetical protein
MPGWGIPADSLVSFLREEISRIHERRVAVALLSLAEVAPLRRKQRTGSYSGKAPSVTEFVRWLTTAVESMFTPYLV